MLFLINNMIFGVICTLFLRYSFFKDDLPRQRQIDNADSDIYAQNASAYN